MKLNNAFFCGMILCVFVIFSCEKQNDRETEIPLDNIDVLNAFSARLSFVQGEVSILKDGLEVPLQDEMFLDAGSKIRTGADASGELIFDSFAVIRLLPSSELELKHLYALASQEKHDVMLHLAEGTVFVSAEKMNSQDEFLIDTPNSVTRIRGTKYMISYDLPVNADSGNDKSQTARTTLAVQDGEVSMLSKDETLSGFMESRLDDDQSNELLMAAFEASLKVGAGKELVFDGLLDSENSPHQITDYSDNTAFLMNYMNYIRDPSSVYETIPAALPPEFFPAYQNRRSPPKEETAPPKPVDPFPSVMWNVQVSDESLNDIINLNDTIFVIDNNGKVSAIDQDAAELWSFDGDANAVTALDDRTAVIANDKMTLLNGTDGAVRGEYAFTWGAVPNAKPVQVPGGIALATLRGVTICRQSNAQVIREIPVSGGIVSSLVLADTELVGINGAGSLIIMNVSAGSIRLEIPLGLGTNILAPRYLNGIIYAANENGRITAVEIESGAKLWETELGAGLSIEPELDAERVYAWTTDKTLIRLSSANGNPVGNPILNVESAPLLFNGKLYWGGKGSTLVVADSSTGRILKSNPIPDSVSVRPLIVGNNLFVGTQSGRLIKVRSEFL